MFKNREEAALKLLDALKKYEHEEGVVVAIPRGGVPIGNILAQGLGLPLDIVLTKKIGHPLNKEYAIGSVNLSGRILASAASGVSRDYINEETKMIREKLSENYKRFMGNRTPIDFKGKTVIVTDDGIATGNTFLGAIEFIRKNNPAKIVAAIPVAPPGPYLEVKEKVEETVCLHVTEDFSSVGQFYEQFSEVSDEEVEYLLSLSQSQLKFENKKNI